MTKPVSPPRLIVPDLARGAALLGIAAANAVQGWIINDWKDSTAAGNTLGGIRPDSSLDQIAAVFSAMFIHVRGLPMFSTLLGFGIGLIAASLYRKSYPLKEGRRVILRRYGILGAFGLVHLLVLFHGDIMLTYGLIGIIIALLLPLPSKILRVIAYLVLVGSALFSTLGAVAMYFYESSVPPLVDTHIAQLSSVGAYFSENFRAGMSTLTSIPIAVVQVGALSLIGYVWAREGYLFEVDRHRRVLITWVAIASSVIVFCGLPWGLSAVGVLDPRLEGSLMVINYGWGMFTGPGIIAGFALATNGIQKRMSAQYAAGETPTTPAWAYPLIALGKRSMSGYLAQSILFILVVMPFGFGAGAEASISGKLAIAVLIWLITLALATILEATNTPGPFEWVHRRLSYGPTGAIEKKEQRNDRT